MSKKIDQKKKEVAKKMEPYKGYFKDWEKHGKQRNISVISGGKVTHYAPHEYDIKSNKPRA